MINTIMGWFKLTPIPPKPMAEKERRDLEWERLRAEELAAQMEWEALPPHRKAARIEYQMFKAMCEKPQQDMTALYLAGLAQAQVTPYPSLADALRNDPYPPMQNIARGSFLDIFG